MIVLQKDINYFYKIRRVVLLVPLFLVACSSVSPATHYYLLSQDLGPVIKINDAKDPIFLKSITLADHLNQAGLVMMLENKKVQVANYHFWGERLDKGVSAVLTHDLEKVCLCRVFDKQLADKQPETAAAVSLHIEQMASTTEGGVLLSGRYRVNYKNEQQVHRFRYQKEMTGSGFQSAIIAKRALITNLATDISSALIE